MTGAGTSSGALIVGDIGGTHARFAIATLRPGQVPLLGVPHRYRTDAHDGLASAWQAFARDCGRPLPRAASLAVATAIEGEVLHFPNSGWVIERGALAVSLDLDDILLVNDFGAVAHAVSMMEAARLQPLAGPVDGPGNGVTTVLGLGTGLGVALLVERAGSVEVVETEAAHIAFAPQTEQEAGLAELLRARHGRCSVERVVSGPALVDIHAHIGGQAASAADLWAAALDGSDPLAAQALDLLVGAFGAAAGDLSLAHGAMRVVVTGGLANRMAARLRQPIFHDRFVAKGRYRPRQERVAIRLATEPEPGLLGAAIAWQRARSA